MRRASLVLAASTLALACATPRPVLYPNETLARAGREQAQREIDECLQLAQRDVGDGAETRGARVAKRTAARTAQGAATGAAVGAAVGGSAARGAAGGAAGAATHAVMGSLLRPRRDRARVDAVFRAYVERCLGDRGYDVIGWRSE
jgi:hypothetical protein